MQRFGIGTGIGTIGLLLELELELKLELELELKQFVCCPLHMYFDKIYLSTEFWLEWLLLLFKFFINNDIRAFGLSQYVSISVTEVSDVDVDFTEAVLMLILYQQRSAIDCLLVLVIIDDIDIGWT